MGLPARRRATWEGLLAAGPDETVRAEPFGAIDLFVGRFFGMEPEE